MTVPGTGCMTLAFELVISFNIDTVFFPYVKL